MVPLLGSLCWLGRHFHCHSECQGERRQRARGRRQSQFSREHTGDGDVLGWGLNSSRLPSTQLCSEDRRPGSRTCMAESCKDPERFAGSQAEACSPLALSSACHCVCVCLHMRASRCGCTHMWICACGGQRTIVACFFSVTVHFLPFLRRFSLF